MGKIVHKDCGKPHGISEACPAPKKILDACCGSRMFWFDKQNPNVVFADIRDEEHTLSDGRKLEINPDVIMDFRYMPFKDGEFKMVIFDPPHLKSAGKNSWMAKKYGLLSENWRHDLQRGFNECWRVLDDWGVLVFKWSEKEITVGEVLKIFEKEPLFGHKTGQSGKTKWICFVKIPHC